MTDEGYARHRARQGMHNVACNLRGVGAKTYALGAPPLERSGTAVIVGAGPSLSRTGDLVARLQDEGAMVFTTNTAHAAVARVCVPDVVMVRESHDVSAHLAHPARCIVADIAAHPACFALADRWFVPAGLHLMDLAYSLGVRPLYGGSASLTACVALAEQWGAARIVLVGVDLAFARDGAGYADGSAYSGYRGTVGAGGVVELEGAGLDAMRAQAGAGALAVRQDTVACAAWGGVGTVRQLLTWADQREWLETFASRWSALGAHCDGVDCYDATGDGARKAGWEEATPSGWVRNAPESQWSDVPAVAVERALADLARQCDTVEATAAAVAGAGLVADVPGWLAGCAVVDASAAGALLRVRDAALSPVANAVESSRALATAAREMRATLTEVV